MKQLTYSLIFLILIDFTFQRCANPGNPTGGPKDTIPPILLNSTPSNGTTNFKGSELELEFSEFINADKLRQQLIITPKTDITFKSIAKRNKLYIKIESQLKDSTTFNFNFANGVTDITEKNPAVNLSLAFSTGPFIDSLSVQGQVEELMTKEPGSEYLVGLYPLTDTLNYFTQNPTYFTTADEEGMYHIEYIKSGRYKIISFDDDNGNYLLDPDTETHGFLEDTIFLDSSIVLAPIRCILQNVKPIELINVRPSGPYSEVKFNKSPNNYTVLPKSLNHNITGDKKDIIRFYKPENILYGDSVSAAIQVSDSLQNTFSDTITVVFLESNRKPANFSVTAEPNKVTLTEKIDILITSNKPITKADSSKFYIKEDTIFRYQLLPTITSNENKTKYNVSFNINKDSILDAYDKVIEQDSASVDTVSSKPSGLRTGKPKKQLKFNIEANAFISIESDSSEALTIPIIENNVPSKAILKLTLDTKYSRFNVQLINNAGKVRYTRKDQKQIDFTNLLPGEYIIRVLIDENEDGRYSYGNLLINEEPEPIYLNPNEISIRENWIIELGISF